MGSVSGIRAPILIRDDGQICNAQGAASSSWVGIENGSQSSITQVGYARTYTDSGAGQFCYFAAYGPNGEYSDQYDCTAQDSAGLYSCWKISLIRLISGYYHAYNCGEDSGSE